VFVALYDAVVVFGEGFLPPRANPQFQNHVLFTACDCFLNFQGMKPDVNVYIKCL